MIKNILAVIGVLSILGGAVAVSVFRPWENGVIVANESATPASVRFDELRAEGVNVESVKTEESKFGKSAPKAVLYLSFSKFYKGAVLLKAYDKAGTEIGRAKRVISGDREDALYFDFDFDSRVPIKNATFFSLSKSQTEIGTAEESVPAAESVPAVPEEEKSLTEVPAENAPAADVVPAEK